jgi:hypothetical protein
MPRLTINLSEERHRALKEASLNRRKSIGALVEESLEFYGIKSRQTALELVAKARDAASLSQDEALQLATKETRAIRNK